MKLNIFAIVILILLLVWVLQAVKIAYSQKQLNWKSAINFLASAFMVVGAVGFFGSALSAYGALGWLPETFEWPIGEAKGALVKADGSLIVPHEPSARIQVYSGDLEFQRGWVVRSGGGKFRLAPISDETFYVYTTRGNKTFIYDINGSLSPPEKSQTGVHKRLQKVQGTVTIPTPFYLKVFIHPFASWLMAAVGMLFLFLTGEFRKRQDSQ